MVALIGLAAVLSQAVQASSIPNFGSSDWRNSSVISRNWGVSVHSFTFAPQTVELMHNVGVKWLRIDADWGNSETAAGHYNFSRLDQFLRQAASMRCRPVLIINGTNRLYGKEPPRSDAASAEFGKFALALFRRYGSRGIVWEVWPESNSDGGLTAFQYTRLVRRVAASRDLAAPKDLLVGFGTAGFDWSYMTQCFQLGILNSIDAVGIHAYGYQIPDEILFTWIELKRLVKEWKPKGKRVDVVSSEWGWPSSYDARETTQAEFAPRMLLANTMSQVPLTIWYDWCDDPTTVLDEATSCGLVRKGGKGEIPKPAYETCYSLTHQLSGFHFLMRLDAGSANDFLAVFECGKELAVVGWTKGKPHSVKVSGLFSDAERLVTLKCLPERIRPDWTQADVREIRNWQRLPLFDYDDFGWLSGTWNQVKRLSRPWYLTNRQSDIPGATDLRKLFGLYCDGFLFLRGSSLRVSKGGEIQQTSLRSPYSKVPFQYKMTKDGFRAKTSDTSTGIKVEAIRHQLSVNLPVGSFPTRRRYDLKFSFPKHGLSCDRTIDELAPDCGTFSHAYFDLGREGDQAPAFTLTGASVAANPPSGKTKAIRIAFNLGGTVKNTVALHTDGKYYTPFSGTPVAAGMWIKSSGLGEEIWCRLIDSSKQVFLFSLGKLSKSGWSWHSVDLTGKPAAHWRGEDDGVVHGPVKWETILAIDPGARVGRKDIILIANPAIAVKRVSG